VLSILLLLIFQVNITWLAQITSALSVGVVGGVKVVPQWAAAAIYFGNEFPPTRITSACLNLLGALLWTYSEAQAAQAKEQLLGDEAPQITNKGNRGSGAVEITPRGSAGSLGVERSDGACNNNL